MNVYMYIYGDVLDGCLRRGVSRWVQGGLGSESPGLGSPSLLCSKQVFMDIGGGDHVTCGMLMCALTLWKKMHQMRMKDLEISSRIECSNKYPSDGS